MNKSTAHLTLFNYTRLRSTGTTQNQLSKLNNNVNTNVQHRYNMLHTSTRSISSSLLHNQPLCCNRYRLYNNTSNRHNDTIYNTQYRYKHKQVYNVTALQKQTSNNNNNNTTIIKHRKPLLFMCCIDGSNNSLRVLQATKNMINTNIDDSLLIVHCIDSNNNINQADTSNILSDPDKLQQEAMQYITNDTTLNIPSDKVRYLRVTPEQYDNIDIRDKLLHIIQEYNVDYVFVARVGYSKLTNKNIGSTANYILNNASTNVVLVQ